MTNNDCDRRFIRLHGRPNCSLCKLEIGNIKLGILVSKIEVQLIIVTDRGNHKCNLSLCAYVTTTNDDTIYALLKQLLFHHHELRQVLPSTPQRLL
jgi:hypothetical protein